MTVDGYVSLKELAAELGIDRSHARRYILGLGLSPVKRRTPDSGGQLTLTISAEEAEYVRRTRDDQGFLGRGNEVSVDTGYFYVIQLVPELDPNRVKLGADDRAARRRN